MIPQNSKSLAFWRLPQTSEINLCAEVDGLVKSGFKVAPFNTEKHPEFLIHSDFQELYTYSDFQSIDFNSLNFHIKNSAPGTYADADEYIGIVQKAIEQIQSQNLSKVVTSRRSMASTLNPDEIRNSFLSLCEKYPDAFVFCFSHPFSGTWMGASPEILIQSLGGTHKSMSLAGTLPIDSSNSWSAKEIEEQSLVTEFLLSKLKAMVANDIALTGPFDKNAGRIKHLCTVIKFNSSLHPTEIARIFHPTPAIAGIPVSQALDVIAKIEGYDREYYTGYCGPSDLNHSTDFFVNLRSIQICSENCIVYSGGGILKSSNPESEWLETVRKSETVLGAIEKM